VERGHPVPRLPLVQVGLDLDDQCFKATYLAQLGSLELIYPITFIGKKKLDNFSFKHITSYQYQCIIY